MVERPYSMAAAVAAIEAWRRENVVSHLLEQLEQLEYDFEYIAAAGELPIWDPEAGPPKRTNGDYPGLYDAWGFPRKLPTLPGRPRRPRRPLFSRYGLHVARVTDALRKCMKMEDVTGSEVFEELASKLDEVAKLRGRGYMYGAISKGVCLQLAAQIAGDDEFALVMASGLSDGSALKCFMEAVDTTLEWAIDPAEASFLRIVHERWMRDGVPDEDFKLLMERLTEADFELLAWLMRGRKLPKALACTWAALAAQALGIVSNSAPDLCHPDEPCGCMVLPLPISWQHSADLAA